MSCAQRALESPGIDRLAQAIAAIAAGYDLVVTGDPLAALAVIDRVERGGGGVDSEWPRAAVALFGAFYAAEQWPGRRQALAARHAEARRRRRRCAPGPVRVGVRAAGHARR